MPEDARKCLCEGPVWRCYYRGFDDGAAVILTKLGAALCPECQHPNVPRAKDGLGGLFICRKCRKGWIT